MPRSLFHHASIQSHRSKASLGFFDRAKAKSAFSPNATRAGGNSPQSFDSFRRRSKVALDRPYPLPCKISNAFLGPMRSPWMLAVELMAAIGDEGVEAMRLLRTFPAASAFPPTHPEEERSPRLHLASSRHWVSVQILRSSQPSPPSSNPEYIQSIPYWHWIRLPYTVPETLTSLNPVLEMSLTYP